jgi:hypothetical protein
MEECGGVAKSAKSDYAKIGWKEKKKERNHFPYIPQVILKTKLFFDLRKQGS